ncbi:CCR4-NOT regulatory complex component [Myotisia sp. PD_48]|nr:CCR4-NOT regulatory complex component [Myotisia sp. PD_48]
MNYFIVLHCCIGYVSLILAHPQGNKQAVEGLIDELTQEQKDSLYPPLVGTNNVVGTRLFGYEGCGNNKSAINDAYDDFRKVSNIHRVKNTIDWSSAAALEYLGSQVQTIFHELLHLWLVSDSQNSQPNPEPSDLRISFDAGELPVEVPAYGPSLCKLLARWRPNDPTQHPTGYYVQRNVRPLMQLYSYPHLPVIRHDLGKLSWDSVGASSFHNFPGCKDLIEEDKDSSSIRIGGLAPDSDYPDEYNMQRREWLEDAGNTFEGDGQEDKDSQKTIGSSRPLEPNSAPLDRFTLKLHQQMDHEFSQLLWTLHYINNTQIGKGQGSPISAEGLSHDVSVTVNSPRNKFETRLTFTYEGKIDGCNPKWGTGMSLRDSSEAWVAPCSKGRNSYGCDEVKEVEWIPWNGASPMASPSYPDSSIQVNGLNYVFPDGTHGLSNIRLDLPQGSRTLLIGANGAGKSTLLRLLSGKRLAPTGTVIIGGVDPFKDGLEGVTYLGVEWVLNPIVRTDIDVPSLLSSVGGDIYTDRRDELVELLDIDLGWRMHAVSDGERRRVQLAMGLLRPWNLLLLDEITVDLDLLSRSNFLAFLKRETESRVCTIVYATHILDNLASWPTHLVHMHRGQVRDWGSMENFYTSHPQRTSENSQLGELVLEWLQRDLKDRGPRPGRPAESKVALV